MKLTVLTIDDSELVQDLLRIVLTEAGMEVVQAEDGKRGLEILSYCKPDIIMTDINMPRMDGYGLIEAVRADPLLNHFPILILTTESADSKKELARKAGATGWITKPFSRRSLVAAVQRVAV